MQLKDIISISGMPGLYKLETNRDNGIIVLQLGDSKRKFISSRQHMFTPLENITIFTDDEGMELKKVFSRMKQSLGDHPIPDPKEAENTIRDYFDDVVPEHDDERVYTSDMRKMIKWYNMLDEAGLLDLEEEEPDQEGKEETNEESTDEEE